MTYDYFESDEFKELLSLYQNAVREGNSYYLDVDDFISLSDYFVDKGEVEQAENVLLQALKIHPESKAVKIALAGVLICNYKFDDANILINDVSETYCYDVCISLSSRSVAPYQPPQKMIASKTPKAMMIPIVNLTINNAILAMTTSNFVIGCGCVYK